MAQFKLAWDITNQHEGAAYNTTTLDDGNVYEGKVYGSKYGITALFLIKQCKVQGVTPEFIKSLTKEDAGKYAKMFVWDKIMQGDEFKNQEVANLVFDWCFQRYGTAIGKIGEVFKMSKSEIAVMKNVLRFSKSLIRDINQSSASVAYYDIRNARYVFSKTSGVYTGVTKNVVLARVRSFNALPKPSCRVKGVLTDESYCERDSLGENPQNQSYFKWLFVGLVASKALKLW